MLRTSLRSVRAVAARPPASTTTTTIAGRQWQNYRGARGTPATATAGWALSGRRHYADAAKPAGVPTAGIDDALTAKSTSSSTPPPPPPPPPPSPSPKKKKGFFRRLRNFFITLTLLSAAGFSAGVWYSRIDDKFHDFFVEYVPYGEQAVLFLEEMDLQKRYPDGRPNGSGPDSNSWAAKDKGNAVRIEPQSGASWRVADSGERTNTAMSESEKKAIESAKKAGSKAKQKVEAAEAAVAKAVPAAATSAATATAEAAADKMGAKSPKPAAKKDNSSPLPPPSPMDPLSVNDAEEPVVQALVKMLNDIITVVNADNSNGRFSSTIVKAKKELDKVGSQIHQLKTQAEQEAANQVGGKVTEFEAAATELVDRVEKAMAAQERAWRQDFEAETRRLQQMYENRVQTEMEREKLIQDQKLENVLLEQAIELKRQFQREIATVVEQERTSRLGKLDQLSSAVRELEKLTTGWNDVVDTNLRTQQLHVAVEAVRASLDSTDVDQHPRPFVRELVALREIASDDDVVNAAIASINPAAYQRGIASPAHLVERFRRVTAEVRKASLLPDDAGVASHASSYLLSKIMFRKEPSHDAVMSGGPSAEVEGILSRTQAFLEEGNLDAAAREMNQLQGWAKTLSRDWLAEVRKALEVRQALDVISTEARLQSLKVQ